MAVCWRGLLRRAVMGKSTALLAQRLAGVGSLGCSWHWARVACVPQSVWADWSASVP